MRTTRQKRLDATFEDGTLNEDAVIAGQTTRADIGADADDAPVGAPTGMRLAKPDHITNPDFDHCHAALSIAPALGLLVRVNQLFPATASHQIGRVTERVERGEPFKRKPTLGPSLAELAARFQEFGASGRGAVVSG